ncbi:hypothetical protein NBO_941g0005 [Nosema bombycis CQ1]|uniref:Uncharacterized protein n=1 Tax=Nosema bombycis (strain CQ1 / CVCC 102059) TaxID=578461 RepID=R0MFY1_NOSB1|nr:hypothetical protein NBO_941g0005 [Nosema bombycis CQ1]|eukprot:EOB11673.1 hypothetical protein NBO_941g0005 [Nosema bombycis CQ1]
MVYYNSCINFNNILPLNILRSIILLKIYITLPNTTPPLTLTLSYTSLHCPPSILPPLNTPSFYELP